MSYQEMIYKGYYLTSQPKRNPAEAIAARKKTARDKRLAVLRTARRIYRSVEPQYISVYLIARMAEVSRSTVYKYRDDLEKEGLWPGNSK